MRFKLFFNQEDSAMRKTTLLYLVLFCIWVIGALSPCHAGSGYYAYTSAQKSTVFFDDFNDNHNNWWKGSSTKIAKVQNGYYLFESLDDISGWAANNIFIDETRDFEIETKIKMVKGPDSESQMLIWGRNKKGNSYRFYFSGKGNFQISDYTDKYHPFLDWTRAKRLQKNEYNKLTVRKAKNTYTFFINEVLVHQMPYKKLYGKGIGFSVGGRCAIHIDFLRVSYLKASPAPQRSTVLYDDFSDNRNNWWKGSSKTIAAVKDGYYHFEATGDSWSWAAQTVEIDRERDFEISAKVKLADSRTTFASGLIWGKKQKTSQYFIFGINKNSQVVIAEFNPEWRPFKPWGKTPFIDMDAYNTLTVKKIGTQCLFYINDNQIHTMPYEPFYGPGIGFHVAPKTKLLVDSLTVSYIEKEPYNPSPEILITQPETTRGIQVVSTQSFRVAGRAWDTNGILRVTANDIGASLLANGDFSVDVPLAEGDNKIVVRATDNRMKSTEKTILVNRKSPRVVPAAVSGVTEKRLALVIGNAAYKHGGSLTNPVNDADAMSRALERLGFQVLTYKNCGQKAMKRAIDAFGRQLKSFDVGLFFYAGHGVQVDGNNYLIPVDARLENKNDVEYDCVLAGRILAKMESAGSGTNIVILDACRDNPFERSWHRGARGKGLAFMNAPAGSLIAYATSPGNTASDGAGTNGLYTSALLRHLDTPGITIEQMFKRVRTTVMDQSGNKQTPWESTSLTGNFYFK